MCGILGFNWQDKQLLDNSLKVIAHRGPDAFGKHIDKYVSLGHRRLSIIDLSESGKQPMSNENKDIQIIFNGEIYNFKELKTQLIKKHNFVSATDTEVLIHLYEESKDFQSFLNQLNGMFAFCIYDSRKKILFLARDRVGIKPLYYYHDKVKKKFMFCSEIKGILENQEIKREVNLEAVSSFLTFRANTEEETCFKGIKKLVPGNYLVYDLKKNILTIKKYFSLNFRKKTNSFFELKKELKELLLDSVQKRRNADVLYGAFLSGGVDSGTIVYLMSNFSDKPIETFSVGFDEHSDETNEARFLSEKLNTNHHELIIEDKSVTHLPSIISHLDEPMSDPTSIPIYMLSNYTKKYCTVILTGEGADELFLGYPQYKFMKMHQNIISHTPKIIRKIPLNIISKTPKNILDKLFIYSSRLGEKGFERFEDFINSDAPAEQYLNQVSVFNHKEKSELLQTSIKRDFVYYRQRFFSNHNSILDNCSLMDLKGNMVEDLLMKIDKNTMAFAIEGRVPFLDHRIVELAFQIPINMKLKNFTNDKFILRDTVKDILPRQTSQRKKKHFFVPIDKWFNNELSQAREYLLSRTFIDKQKIFNYNYIQKINKNYKGSPLFYSRQLWSLLTFQIWYKQFIEGEKIKI